MPRGLRVAARLLRRLVAVELARAPRLGEPLRGGRCARAASRRECRDAPAARCADGGRRRRGRHGAGAQPALLLAFAAQQSGALRAPQGGGLCRRAAVACGAWGAYHGQPHPREVRGRDVVAAHNDGWLLRPPPDRPRRPVGVLGQGSGGTPPTPVAAAAWVTRRAVAGPVGRSDGGDEAPIAGYVALPVDVASAAG